jgi:cbb3-type cytochrome oxidase maturation protein
MEVILILIPLALLLGLFFIGAFIWSAKKGQYDDLETPKFRMLLDDKKISKLTMEPIKDSK